MHVFRHLSKPVQWLLALFLTVLCFGILGLCFTLPFFGWHWLPLPFIAVVCTAPLESLLLTPLYVLTGRFQYYSSMLLATRRHDGGLDLHVGTLFDYVLRLRWTDRGPRAARIVTTELLRGLLAITEDIERGVLDPDVELVATSYFFSQRTVSRLGCELRDPPQTAVYNLLLASPSIALRLSFTRGRLSFPNVRKMHQAVVRGSQLVRHKQEMQQVLGWLKRRAIDPT